VLRDHKLNSKEEEAGTIRKKQRSENQQQQQESSSQHLGSNSQWLFQHANNGSSSSSSIVLSDHLGDTSQIVESMTHQVGHWSLTSLSQQNNNKGRANKERCKAARHNVMRAFLHSGQSNNEISE
jgi:hypothetical protein